MFRGSWGWSVNRHKQLENSDDGWFYKQKVAGAQLASDAAGINSDVKARHSAAHWCSCTNM
jgi:hypothetical protein